MLATALSNRELNQNMDRAKRAARTGPVFITTRGKPTHVLLSIEEYERLTRKHRNMANTLAMPGVADIELNPPSADIGARPADFS